MVETKEKKNNKSERGESQDRSNKEGMKQIRSISLSEN